MVCWLFVSLISLCLFFPLFGLVGCFGVNGPLRQYFSLYRAASLWDRAQYRLKYCLKESLTPPNPHTLQKGNREEKLDKSTSSMSIDIKLRFTSFLIFVSRIWTKEGKTRDIVQWKSIHCFKEFCFQSDSTQGKQASALATELSQIQTAFDKISSELRQR